MSSWYATLFETDGMCWVGLGLSAFVLAVVAVVLARFRFIQSRPLSACVVLSILAHVLLCLAACLMQLFESPRFPGGTTITMRLVSDAAVPAGAEQPGEEPQAREPESPEHTVTPAQLESMPAVPEPETPAVVSPVTPPAEFPDTPVDPMPPPEKTRQSAPEMADTVAPSPRDPIDPPLMSSVPPLDVPAASVDEWFPVTSAPPIANADSESAATTSNENEERTPGFPAEFSHRDPDAREQLLLRYGGNGDTEAAVKAALSWLARHQLPDGRWSARQHGAGTADVVAGQSRRGIGLQADTGITGLAVLAFLGSGHTVEHGAYQPTLQRALDYLRQSQLPTGDLAGAADHFARTYCHGIATLAIGEATCLTGGTGGSDLHEVLRRALQFTQSGQNGATGGWRYRRGEAGDTSQFGWQVMALASGQHAGFTIPPSTSRGLQQFLRMVSSGRHGGLASYRPHGRPTPAMTAEAAVCHLMLYGGGSRAVDEAMQWVARRPPSEEPLNLYYCYYGSLALHLAGSIPDRWNQSMQQAILSRQDRRGTNAGSWPTATRWGRCGGRVYTTAMAALCLEVYYRHLPLVDRTLARR